MNTYTFVCEEGKSFLYPHHNDTKSTVTFKATTLDDIVHHFELFLKGCGFELGDQRLELVRDWEPEEFDTDGKC